MRPRAGARGFAGGPSSNGCTVAIGCPRSVTVSGSRVLATSFRTAMHFALNWEATMVFIGP